MSASAAARGETGRKNVEIPHGADRDSLDDAGHPIRARDRPASQQRQQVVAGRFAAVDVYGCRRALYVLRQYWGGTMVKERRVPSAASHVGPAVLLLLALAIGGVFFLAAGAQTARHWAGSPRCSPRRGAGDLIPAHFADLQMDVGPARRRAPGAAAIVRQMTGRWSEEWFSRK